MGIHDKSFAVLEWYFSHFPNTHSVLELGSQNFYQNYGEVKYGMYGDKYYKVKGVKHYECIDINGENNAHKWDLSKPVEPFGAYNLVTDFGTQEHISFSCDMTALYNCWTTKYYACSSHIISANPKTNNWAYHGAYYFTMDFYRVLARLTNMKILRLEEQFAMGNDIDGWEIMCVLEKTPNSHWIPLEEFKEAFAFVSMK
jgi:hypothetical protein